MQEKDLKKNHKRIDKILKYPDIRRHTTKSFGTQRFDAIYNPIRLAQFKKYNASLWKQKIADRFSAKAIKLCRNPQNRDYLEKIAIELTGLEASKPLQSTYYPTELSNAVASGEAGGLAGPVECAAVKVLLALDEQGHQIKDPKIAEWVKKRAVSVKEASARKEQKVLEKKQAESFFQETKASLLQNAQNPDMLTNIEATLIEKSALKTAPDPAYASYGYVLTGAVISKTPRGSVGQMQLAAGELLLLLAKTGHEIVDPDASAWVKMTNKEQAQYVADQKRMALETVAKHQFKFLRPKGLTENPPLGQTNNTLKS